MKPEEFVAGVKNEIIERGIASHRDMYENPRVVTEDISFYRKLTEGEKEVFFRILRQVQVDTVAVFLSLLDGAFFLEGQSEDFKLICLDSSEEVINGDLADIFLRTEYKWER